MPKKPAPRNEAKPDLTYEPDGSPARLFVVSDIASGMWMLPAGGGWSSKLVHAGTFTEEKARELAAENHVVAPLFVAVRSYCHAANPVVLQAIAALGSR